MTQINFNAH